MSSSLVKQFVSVFESLRGHAYVVSDWAEAARLAAKICAEAEARCVALGELPESFGDVFRADGRWETLSAPYAQSTLPAKIDKAQVGIGVAEFGIAATGTLVEVNTDDAYRLVSALPRCYIGIVEADEMVEDLRGSGPRLRDAFERHSKNCVVSFISGPSRTGDIEMILTLGVHGPEQAHAIIVENSERA